MKNSVDSWVRPGEVSARIYSDPELFHAEMTHLFPRSWLLLGHECQVPSTGDYFLGRLGLQSVVVTRDQAGTVRVFENRCAHRGSTLCAERRGHVSRFVCPYHSWSFALDGRLVGVPLKEEYGTDFDWSSHGLAQVPHVKLYRGFIFASYRPVAGLEGFLGEARLCFDDLVDRAPQLELEYLDTELRYRVRANWKLILENLNDVLHPLSAHASALKALSKVKNSADLNPVTRAAAASPAPQLLQKVNSVITEHGHSYMEGFLRANNIRAPRDAYFEELANRRGVSEAERVLNTDLLVTLLYPSATITSPQQTIRLVRPISVNETEVVAFAYRLKGAPETIQRRALDYVWVSSSPSSFVIVDDLEIYERCQSSYEANPTAWVSVHRGGVDDRGASASSQIPGTSEQYIRNQHRVWSRYLSGELQ